MPVKNGASIQGIFPRDDYRCRRGKIVRTLKLLRNCVFGLQHRLDGDCIAEGAARRAQADGMEPWQQGRWQEQIALPLSRTGLGDRERRQAVSIDFHPDGVSRDAIEAAEIDADVLVAMRMKGVVVGPIVYRRNEARRAAGRILGGWFPSSRAARRGTAAGTVDQIDTCKSRGAAKGQKALSGGSEPVIDLAAQLVSFVELHATCVVGRLSTVSYE